MVESVEAAAQVLADVSSEKDRGSVPAVLRDVTELVSEKSERVPGFVLDARGGRPRQENAPSESDRVRARQERQEACEPAAVEAGAIDFRGELRAEAPGEGRGETVAGQGLRAEEGPSQRRDLLQLDVVPDLPGEDELVPGVHGSAVRLGGAESP